MTDGPPPAASERSEGAEDAVLDLEQVGQLMRLGPEVFRPLVETYAAGAREQIEVIDAALDAGDCDAAGRAAHQLRGSSLTLGARRVSAAAMEIESHAGAGRTDEASALRAALRSEVAAATAALRTAAGDNT